MSSPFNHRSASADIEQAWATTYLDALLDLIKIPAVSPAFDPEWQATGGIERIVAYASAWLISQEVDDLEVTVSQIAGRTPALVASMPGSSPDAPTVVLYGHLDKQPGSGAWTKAPGPWEPAVDSDAQRVYGRGAADDVYALLAGWGAIEAVRRHGSRYPRCTLLLECSEESSSEDLDAHLNAQADLLGRPDLVICLDGLSPDGNRLWRTSSLRGILVADLTVATLEASVHSGDAGGIVPSPYRLTRLLLDRLEDASTGEVVVRALEPDPPESASEVVAEMLRSGIPGPGDGFAFLDGVQADRSGLGDQLLHRAFGASVTYAGLDGLPPTRQAASVVVPEVTTRLSIRLPPTVEPDNAVAALRKVLTERPPSGAKVSLDLVASVAGWQAGPLSPRLEAAVQSASERCFSAPPARYAAGMTIPVVGMLARRFPGVPVLPLGALGPDSAAHAPDESLDLAAARRITLAVAQILAEGV